MEIKVNFKDFSAVELTVLVELLIGDNYFSLERVAPELAASLVDVVLKECDSRAMDCATGEYTLNVEFRRSEEGFSDWARAAIEWLRAAAARGDKDPELMKSCALLGSIAESIDDELSNML